MSQSYTITLRKRDSDGNVTNTRSLLSQSDRFADAIEVVREHTAMSDAEIPVRLPDYQTIEKDWISPTTDLLIEVNGDLIFRGFATTLEGDEESGEAVLAGPDIFAKLRRFNEVGYVPSNLPRATHKVINDFVDDKIITPGIFNSHTRNSPSPTQIANNKPWDVTGDGDGIVDDKTEWQNNTAPGDKPIYYLGGLGGIAMRQHSWTVEGEDRDLSTGITVTDSAYSNGEGEQLGQGDSASWDFTPQYDLDAGDFDVAARYVDVNSPTDLTVNILDSNANTLDITTLPSNGTLGWESVVDNGNSFSGFTFFSGSTYTVELVANGGPSTGFDIDVVQPHDERYTYDYHNNNGGGGGYLTGPELYTKTGIQVDVSEYTQNAANITSADATITWFNDDAFGAQISLSNDGRSTYGTISNTTSGTVDFANNVNTVGTNLAVRIQLSGQGTRTGQTPLEGFNPGGIEELEIDFDGNDLDVIESARFDGSYFDILQSLHERAGYRWSANYNDSFLGFESFPKGETNSATWTVKNRERVLDTNGYANAVTAVGAESAGYPSDTAEDQGEINSRGRIEWFVKDSDIESQTDAESKARQELTSRLDKDTLSAAVEIVAASVQPGYRYDVDMPDSQGNAAPTPMDLERVEYRERGGEADGVLQFQISPVLDEKTTENTGNIQRTERSL